MHLGKPRSASKVLPGSQTPSVLRLKPLAQIIALWVLASGAQAAPAFSSGWFANKAGQPGPATGSQPSVQLPGTPPPLAQQQRVNQQLQRSLGNLNNTVAAIAAQQASQAAGRQAALSMPSNIPNGLGEGGLKVDSNPLTQGWVNASAPQQQQVDGKTTVTIGQTADKAILNWETFNVGRDTTVNFQQQADWAVLNRVNDPNARPSQIQGQIKADGTVMLVNRNGILFSGSSQVDTRNLVVAAATISDTQFRERGLYHDADGTQATFTDAAGNIAVGRGAQLNTRAPASSTQGGGYVLLLGQEVDNAGSIITAKGQTVLAAGDTFYIRKGVGTEGNTTSTTRGLEVAATRKAGSSAGAVSNNGLIQAANGDILLTGHKVAQNAVALASTSVDARGAIHLLNAASDSDGSVTLGQGSTTAVLLDASSAGALDSQRNGALTALGGLGNRIGGAFDNLSGVADRRDQSRVEIVSGGTVDFQDGSITLATGGQVAVSAGKRSLVRDGAVIDVAGAVGVQLSMQSNSIKVNVQGNEQRDASVNREGGALNSKDVWVDIRELVHVPAGTNGSTAERWYTAGGLLEVGGYLGTSNHSLGEWMAQGGTVSFTGNDVVSQGGSQINLSGGSLDVQGGYLRQSWLKGADGRLYEVSRAPGDVLYQGIYQGFEQSSARWGQSTHYYNPLIAPRQRYENGYSVGRDAGKLVIGTRNAVLEGEMLSQTYQGDLQDRKPGLAVDGYLQSHKALARGAQLIIGDYLAYYHKDSNQLLEQLGASSRTLQSVVFANDTQKIATALDLQGLVPQDRQGRLLLDSQQLNSFNLGAIRVAANQQVRVEGDLQVANGGEIALHGPQVEVGGNLTAHSGSLVLGNVRYQRGNGQRLEDTLIGTLGQQTATVSLASDKRLDTSGAWADVSLDPLNQAGLAWIDGGNVSIRSSGNVALADGSLIRVDSAAGLLAGGSLRGGKGGNLTIASDDFAGNGSGVLSLGSALRGYGVSGAGTLSLQSNRVQIGGAPGKDAGLYLAQDFFDKGFASYNVIGSRGLSVAADSQVQVSRPVYQVLDSSVQQLDLWTPALYQEDASRGRLTQRAGASLTLQAGTTQTQATDVPGITLDIGRGSRIEVDPTQAITLRGIGQMTLDGTLRAQSGSVRIEALPFAVQGAHQRAIHLGDHALLDVSAQAVTARDALGQRYGLVRDGGSIVVGAALDPLTGKAAAPDLFVQMDSGARLLASGSQATLDVIGQGPTAVASNGGSIAISSKNGLYLDGQLQALAGGAGAAGGRLSVALESDIYERTLDGVEQMLKPRELLLSQLRRTYDTKTLKYGHGHLSVEQVDAGGFDSLALLSNGMISFDGDVQLELGQSLALYSAAMGLAEGAAGNSRVSLSAPTVRLAGVPILTSDRAIVPVVRGGASQQHNQAHLSVDSGLLDIRDEVVFGARGTIEQVGGPGLLLDRRGFATIDLRSRGDLRLLQATGTKSFTRLTTPGELNLVAAQIYPGTNAKAVIRADELRIARAASADPAQPYSLFGSLALEARVIDQGGVVRAPLGSLALGYDATTNATEQVNLLPGSLTSVSAAGLLMPYGGSVDGLEYRYAGQSLTQSLLSTLPTPNAFSVRLTAQAVDVQGGAVIDLSGGGEVQGAGFVSGRGGSTDARLYPLVQTASDGRFSLPSLADNPVYALVPGVQAGYAPSAADAGAGDPLLGQQLTLGAGVPGLPAGTYTLLPSTYALLPGAFRVELNGALGLGAAQPTVAMRNGSWSSSGQLSIQGTSFAENRSRQFILTSADVLRRYSQYNETSLASFITADAARLGVPRAALPADAKALTLNLLTNRTGRDAFTFDGTLHDNAQQGGRGSTATLISSNVRIEVMAAGAQASAGFDGISVHADQLNAIGASSLRIGALSSVAYGQGGNYISFDEPVITAGKDVYLRSGAELRAPEVMLISGRTDGEIVVEQGAHINTLGLGKPGYDSKDGFIYAAGRNSVLAVSNGWLDILAPSASSNQSGAGRILIGTCASVCAGQTQLYSEGTIAAATDKQFELGDQVAYGTRNLTLAVGGINVGTAQSLSAMAAQGLLPNGLTLNQSLLQRLLRGDTQNGAPALEALTLNVRDAMNFYGSVSLDTFDPGTGRSSLAQLVLGTPAIYGYGTAQDVASIRAGSLIWNGSAQAPGTLVAGGAGSGSGRLTIQAERVELGYGPKTQPKQEESARLVLGFDTFELNASERVTANHKGNLNVYQQQGAYESGKGYAYSGGNLLINTPLMTGEAGSVSRITAGGDLRVLGVSGAKAATVDKLGAQLTLEGRSVLLDTQVSLPSGKLSVHAEQELQLGANSRLDLAGRAVAFNDVNKYSWGGDLTLQSRHANVLQAAGGLIDLSARNNQGGLLTAIALDEGAGWVSLQGSLLGGATGHYDAGGTWVPFKAGGVDIRAQHLDDFVALNQRLNQGQFFGRRSVQLKQGDLVIGDELKASEINVSLDNGHLTIAGRVDASGEQVGSIRLAGRHGLSLLDGAQLDAHGSLLRVDSYGKIIDAPNRASIELNAGDGRLTLAAGSRIDLRHGTAATPGKAAGQHDGQARGTLELYAPRLGGVSAGDIDMLAATGLSIDGARSIAVNANWRYDDSDSDAVIRDGSQAVSQKPYREINQAYLDLKHAQSTAFIQAALSNGNLRDNKLAGLTGTYAEQLHLRPSVEISSTHDIVVQGDLDLSAYRYNSLNPHTPMTSVYGSGEVGNLLLRTAGDLSVLGSINDGFAPPPPTPDDNGWQLLAGLQPFGGDVVVPGLGVTLAEGTTFLSGKTLNYELPIKATTFVAGMVLPVEGVLAKPLNLIAGSVLSADVFDAQGRLMYPAGTLLASAVTLPSGTRLAAGTRLASSTALQALRWPKGVPLPTTLNDILSQPAFVVLDSNLALLQGALIPSQTNVKLPGNALSLDLRTVGSAGQGSNWAIAPMLAAGSQSWSLRLVAGADLAAADSRAVLADSTGQVMLSDAHYSLYRDREITLVPGQAAGKWYLGPAASTDDWSWVGAEGDPLPDWFGLGECEGAPDLCVFKPTYTWATGNGAGGTPGSAVDDTERNLCDSNPAWCVADPGTPDQYVPGDVNRILPMAPVFSVLRTGTGDLDLVSAGDLLLGSLFGVYTAGTNASDVSAGYNRKRGTAENGTVLGGYSQSEFYKNLQYKDGSEPGKASFAQQVAGYEQLVDGNSLYQAWYPENGGNLWLSAGGDLRGDVLATTQTTVDRASSSVDMGNWLWRQGSGSAALDETIATAWWINFGSYVLNERAIPQVSGFTGFGTLGGGDVEVRVTGSAGALARRGTPLMNEDLRSEGLIVAVGSTGRVSADQRLALTGGGDLQMHLGASLNPSPTTTLIRRGVGNLNLNGALINLRGTAGVNAGASGQIDLVYGRDSHQQDPREVRAYDTFSASMATASGGLVLVPGDATFNLSTRGDLVLGGVSDPGRVRLSNTSSYTLGGVEHGDGASGFSLWTERTAIDLFAAGGNLTPSTQVGDTLSDGTPRARFNTTASDGRFVYPSILRAAAGGSLYYGASAQYSGDNRPMADLYGLLLAPGRQGQLELLAGNSIYAAGYAISTSGAPAAALATPFAPAFVGGNRVSNLSADGIKPSLGSYPLFAFGADSASVLQAAAQPTRMYAVNGDLVGVRTGEILQFSPLSRSGATWYVGAAPVSMYAGRDIVNSGTPLSQPGGVVFELTESISGGSQSLGNLFAHSAITDHSQVVAGRDILFSSFNVAGPGTLTLSAGRDIRMEDRASLTSLGAIVAGDSRPGASVLMQAGVASNGLDYQRFAALYLDPTNLAASDQPLAAQAGKVVKTYAEELRQWLADRYGFSGTAEQAREVFAGLSVSEQGVFARQVYFAELRAGGLEYNTTGGPRQGSYLRGRNAIEALFPGRDVAGNPLSYEGDIVMYGGAGVHTNFGGDIQMFTPGGQLVFGVEGEAPPSTAGVITQGQGNIQLYSNGSILLGQSRVMTTFGGSILGWSAQGDINAGRGSKTTVVYTPPRRVYDNWGNVRLSPSVPSTGAGIATLNPIAEVAPGDIDLIAPLGTIDAGEAGIRVSGNVNIAALQVVNAANIQVQGDAKGMPVVASVNTGAISSASAAASSASQAAEDAARQQQSAARQRQPSVITVQVLGFGSERLIPGRDGASLSPQYNRQSPVQVLGAGALDEQARAQLTEEERGNLTL
ncbi:filamentous hemagglutinin family protein [Pseudomonas fontis]|uniref:Filamentous hemagglutinin family protein n=1 Tax=Pseudomonas fontis TaxID=2942633 RepID=A0ABT5NPX6_9PSED|nr:filamentous hemagglutinin family protein [Pseudomonas fontis]MDD0974716.1 filamentous hemagglutinin family protein [Pseudomonas fontis]MDD0990211.1 filamentous hemagglutinin family protein [Pseudomonas fontis]